MLASLRRCHSKHLAGFIALPCYMGLLPTMPSFDLRYKPSEPHCCPLRPSTAGAAVAYATHTVDGDWSGEAGGGSHCACMLCQLHGVAPPDVHLGARRVAETSCIAVSEPGLNLQGLKRRLTDSAVLTALAACLQMLP